MLIILQNNTSIRLSILKKKLFLRHNFENEIERDVKEKSRSSR